MSDTSDCRELRPRVKAAIEYMEHCRLVTQPYSDSGAQDRSRDLTNLEQGAYNSAISMLTRYFTGEIDLGDSPLCETSEPEEEVKKKKKEAKVK